MVTTRILDSVIGKLDKKGDHFMAFCQDMYRYKIRRLHKF